MSAEDAQGVWVEGGRITSIEEVVDVRLELSEQDAWRQHFHAALHLLQATTGVVSDALLEQASQINCWVWNRGAGNEHTP